MREIATCQLRLRKRPLPPAIGLAVFCAAALILLRSTPTTTVFQYEGIAFAYTDIFVIIAAGLGGLGCGLLSFVILFIGEFLRVGGDFSLYAVSTYLILILISAWFAYAGFFRGFRKSALCCLLLSAVLALCWMVTFTIAIPGEDFENIFRNRSYWRLFLGALPETALSVALITLFFRYAPAKVKYSIGSGWLYAGSGQDEEERWQIMAIRVTAFSLVEAVILSLSAIVCTDLFAASESGTVFNVRYILSMWRQNLRLGLMMMCTAIPLAYLFNTLIMKYVVHPIHAMSFLMERYFKVSEEERARALPNLDIHTGDEVERLYHSLQKMVADMGTYIDRALEQERKSARLTHEFMLALAKAVDAKDHYTSGHSVRVARYAREIARRMGKTPEEQESIYIMGLLHDIGKIGVPEAIINKKGKLTDEEFLKIKEHPALGYGILKFVKEIPTLATGARWHHERYDGHGYPDGLSGENIPEEARIICVADAYDALTSNRAYSTIRPQADVRAEILRCRGSQFDPWIADIMVGMIDDDPDYKMCEPAAHSATGKSA